VNSILGRKSVSPKTKEFGELFESFIYLELKAYTDYFSMDSCLNFWRLDQETEVDFVVNENVGIEVKATDMVQEKHLKGLKRLNEMSSLKRQIVVSQDPERRKIGKVEIIPYKEFLLELWEGKIF
jgi:predicted AAA+ superfamily ATPase